MKNKHTTTSPARKEPRSTPLGLASATELRTFPFMKIAAFANAVFGLMVFGGGASSALGATVTYITLPLANNGSSSLPTATSYTSNLGYAFKTGASGPFDIDWVSLEMTSGLSNTSGTFKIAIHSTTDDIPYSAVADSTAYATDVVNFTTPVTPSTPFTLHFSADDLPNIKDYDLLPNETYSLILYNTSSSIALRRTQGLANGTTNDAYTVDSGFTVLDTFRNNTANYTNSANSYPAFAISFGATTSAIPEPAQSVGLASFLASALLLRYRRKPLLAAPQAAH
jgi:hypothetical protein